jgi:hypothetical protein
MKEELRSLRSLQNGNENRSELFALTRILPNARPPGCPSMSHRFPLAPFLSQTSLYSCFCVLPYYFMLQAAALPGRFPSQS